MKHQVVIVGAGLSALTAACRLVTKGITDIGIYSPAFGGTPFIAAIDFVLPGNPDHDTAVCYEEDMMRAGFNLNNRDLVHTMVSHSEETYKFLVSLGIEFSKLDDGSLRRRHLSGSTYPRSLCSTTGLIGMSMVDKLTGFLKENGIEIHSGCKVYSLSVSGSRVNGISFTERDGTVFSVQAGTVIAAWGGVGNLFGRSTYPADENGRTIAVAYDAGIKLIDLEFLEYEPMVVMSPEGAAGEPCPTAMLGEGAQLLNNQYERFLLKVRPQGEAGAPKTLINRSIWQQVQDGKGTAHGGCYVDLRMIPVATLKLYPWFYNRLMLNGVDPHITLVEVGPMAHSFSGGIQVDTSCRSNLDNLYAVGEAAGGFHGACRMAGNAASQAAVSGLIAADAVAERDNTVPVCKIKAAPYLMNVPVQRKINPSIDEAAKALGVYRNGSDLLKSVNRLQALIDEPDIDKDTDTKLRAEAVWLMARAALKRTESRGTHNRTDYPQQDDSQLHSNLFYREA